MSEPEEQEKKSPEDGLLNQLTDDQKKLLFQAIEIVKQQVFSESVKRFRNYLLIAVSLVTLFGAVSVVGLKSAIKDATVSALREDASLRQSIKDDAASKVTKAKELIAKIEAIHAEAKSFQESEAALTKAELERLVSELKAKTQEDNLLFERSAKELNELVIKLKQLIETKETSK